MISLEIVYISLRRRPFLYIASVLATSIAFLHIVFPQGKNSFDILRSKSDTYRGRVINWPRISNNRTSFILKLDNGSKILVTLNTVDPTLTKGHYLEIQGKPSQPHTAKNPGEFDFKRYLSLRDIYFVMRVEPDDLTILKNPNLYDTIISQIRNSVISAIHKNISDKQNAAILSQMLIGKKEDASRELRPFFIDSGVMHILVISGLHVGYIVIIFWYFFRLLGLSRKNSAIVMLPFLWTYVVLTGSNPPVVRAASMSTIIVLSLTLERGYDLFQALGLAATLNLLATPKDLFNPSFQLSYAATIGIMYLTPKIQKPFLSFPWPLSKIGQLFCITTSAQLFSAPLIAYYFNKTSIIAFLSNLFVVPWIGIIIGGGIILVISDILFPPLVGLVGVIVTTMIETLIKIVKFFSTLPGAGLWTASPSFYFFIVYYLPLFVLPRFFYGKLWKILSAVVVLSVIFLYISSEHKKSDIVTVTFLSLEGDSILVEFPNKRRYLIDAGGSYSRNDIGRSKILPFLKYKNIKKLDRVFITIPDIPHYGGLIDLLEDIKIGEVCVPPLMSTEQEYLTLMESLDLKKIPVKELWAPYRFLEGETKISILNPIRRSSVWDDNSLVILLEHMGKKVLFTSDISKNIEKRLNLKDVDVLQIPRHGQKISKTFVRKLSPNYAIISGRSISRRNIQTTGRTKILNTHTDGAITLSIGKTIEIKTHKKRKTESIR